MDAHHFDLTGMPRPDQLGIEIHRKTLDGVKKMRNSHEQQLTWIDEALIEARKTFSSPQIYLIPKTPSTKRTQRLTEVVEDDESTDEQFSSRVQQKKKKHKMTTRRARALIEAEDTTASSQDDGFFLDAENKISEGDPDGAKEPVRKTRNRKKACMAAKSRRTRRNNNSATSKEEGKTSAPVGRGKSRSNRNQPASNSDSDMLSPVKMDVDSADGGNSTAVSDARNETLVSDAGSEMVSDAEKEMPASGAGNEVQVSGPGNEVQVSGPGNEVPVSGAGNEVLVSDDGNEVPVSDEGNEVPISDAENEVPVSDDGNDMPVSDAGNEMPVSDVRKKMPVSDAKQVHILTISSSEDSDMSDEASAHPQKASSSSTIRQKSSHTDQVSSSHTTDRVVPDAAAAEQMQDFHLLRVKEKASKFEKLVHVNGSSNDHCSNTTASSPRRPAVLTGPDAQAAKAAFDMLLGSAAKTQQVRRSSRLSAQSKPEESLTAKAPSLAWTKLQLMKAANACNETASPIPMRTTRSKMRAVMGKQKPEVCGEFRKDVMSSSDDEFRMSRPTTATASSHDASGIDRLGLNLPGRTTRSKMRKQLEKENLDSPTVKRPATAKLASGLPYKKMCFEASLIGDKGDYSLGKIPQFTRLTPNNRQKPMLTNICMSSFLKRNTSSKKTELDLIKMKHEQLLAKEEESRKRRLRIQEQKLREAEEKRRNREHRQALAAERRREQEKRKQGLTEKELRKEQEKMVLKTKLQEQKQQEERERHKYREMKLEETRKREMEKQREKQEQILEQEAERHRQIENHLRKKLQEQQFCQKQSQENRKKNEEHQKKLEQERQLEAEKCQQAQQQQDKEREFLLKEKQNREKLERLHREKMDIEKQNMNNRQKQMELEREKQMEHQRFKEEMAKTREACNAKEKERCPLMHAEKQADSPKPHQAEYTHHPAVNNKAGVEVAAEGKPGNSSQLNATFKKNEMNDENSDNYDMTPVRKVYSKCCCDENYNIDDIRSDDSTDEDEAPRKKIPSWATGEQLKLQLISQYYTPPDLDNIFGVIDMPDLCEMFSKKKPKFYKRTSSAVWNSPLYLPSGKPYQE